MGPMNFSCVHIMQTEAFSTNAFSMADSSVFTLHLRSSGYKMEPETAMICMSKLVFSFRYSEDDSLIFDKLITAAPPPFF